MHVSTTVLQNLEAKPSWPYTWFYTYKQCTDLAKAKSKGSINTYVQFQLLKTKKIPMKKLQEAYANPEIYTYSD